MIVTAEFASTGLLEHSHVDLPVTVHVKFAALSGMVQLGAALFVAANVVSLSIQNKGFGAESPGLKVHIVLHAVNVV